MERNRRSNMKEQQINHIKKTIYILLPVPLILGFYGYYISGQSIADSLYYAVCLYGFEWDSIANNIYIEIARWSAPFVAAAGVASIIKSVLLYFRSKIITVFSKDAVAVYSNSVTGEIINENIKNSILCKIPSRFVKNHIIAFETDKENLLFYQKYKEIFNKKQETNVYLCLNEIDSNLLKAEMDNVRTFCWNEIIARDLWKKIKLWNCKNRTKIQKIVIIGFEKLGQEILDVGLQMNLYDKNQCIEYHVFGEERVYCTARKYFQTMNGDIVIYHRGDFVDDLEVISEADYIIVSRNEKIETLQSIYYSTEKAKIYYYSRENERFFDYTKMNRMYSFGEDCEVYTNENIRLDKIYARAKRAHYNYVCNAGTLEASSNIDAEWRKLDGFTKGSNLSSSDYQLILQEVVHTDKENEKTIQLEEYAELEHIRWCRYHFINGWKYGIPENGKNKDMDKKIHICLCPYMELPEEEKVKDRQAIEEVLKKNEIYSL